MGLDKLLDKLTRAITSRIFKQLGLDQKAFPAEFEQTSKTLADRLYKTHRSSGLQITDAEQVLEDEYWLFISLYNAAKSTAVGKKLCLSIAISAYNSAPLVI